MTLTRYRLPGLTIMRFVTRRLSWPAVIWGLVFGATTISSALGYESLYKTGAARLQLVNSFGNNAGLKALFGDAFHLDTVGGFVTWRSIGVIVIIGAIWGLLTATKQFRGEEEAGRLELFLTGPTSARKAVLNIFGGLATALLLIFAITTLCLYFGHKNSTGFSFSSSAFGGLTCVASIAEFMALGAFISQLAPIRRRASTITAVIFAVAFLARAGADVDSGISWLANYTPLGWIEKLHPLTYSNPVWLLPIAVWVLVLGSLTVYLAGRRDLGASLLADKYSSRPHLRLLNSSYGLAIREESNVVLGWLAGITFIGLFYGYISKSAADAFKNTSGFTRVVGKVSPQLQSLSVKTFLSVTFLLALVVILIQIANLVNAMRQDEAQGYLDNLLVRPISRLQWLLGRLAVIAVAVLGSAILVSLGAWLAETSQHGGVSWHDIYIAGLNILPAALFMLGFSLFIYGFKPRLMFLLYAVAAWSFLDEMIGPAINLNHWALDASILHHVALAPSASPRWHIAGIYAGLGLALLIAGAWRFIGRDLEAE